MSRKAIFTFAVTGSLAFISIGLVGHFSNGFEGRLSDQERFLLSYESYEIDLPYQVGKCFLGGKQRHTDFSDDCLRSAELSSFTLIWGDSHAAALSYGFKKGFKATGQLTASGCLPLIGYDPIERPHCKKINERVLDEIEKIKPTRLILHANWSRKENEIDVPDGLVRALDATLANIQSRTPNTKLIVVGGVPQWQPTLPSVMVHKGIRLQEKALVYSERYRDISSLDNYIREVAESRGVKFVPILASFCSNERCLSSVPIKAGSMSYEPFAWDYGHLTKSSSVLIFEKLFLQILDE